MLKYLLTLTGSALIFREIYKYFTLKDKKTKLLKKIYKPGDSIEVDEYIYEYTFGNNSDCHKVIIETFKVKNGDLIQNSHMSFVHIRDKSFKCNNNDSKERFSNIKYTTSSYYKQGGKDLLKLQYDIDLDEIINDYSLIKVSRGPKVNKIYSHCKKLNGKTIVLSFSNDLQTLMDNIGKNNYELNYYIGLLLIITAFTIPKKIRFG